MHAPFVVVWNALRRLRACTATPAGHTTLTWPVSHPNVSLTRAHVFLPPPSCLCLPFRQIPPPPKKCLLPSHTQIIKTATVPASACKRDNTKQFHDSKIKFPLTHRVSLCPPPPHAPWSVWGWLVWTAASETPPPACPAVYLELVWNCCMCCEGGRQAKLAVAPS